MAVTATSRGSRRIAVGDEGRRSNNYQTSKFQSKYHNAPSLDSSSSYSRYARYARHFAAQGGGGGGLWWFMKQIAPGVLLLIGFWTFRNLDRGTQLRFMSYYSQSYTAPAVQALPPQAQQQQQQQMMLAQTPPSPRLGARVPRALENLADMSTVYNPKAETPYFWDIHFAGETVAESVFTKCHFLIQACEHGLKQPDYNDEKLEVFETPTGALYVNVDTTTAQGIRRAQHLGLADQRMADVMMSQELHLFSSSIFSHQQKGRLFALFRDPISRAVSMYHYLSAASWDPLYNPQLKYTSIEEYAKGPSVENNWMTRFLVNKPGGSLSKQDMIEAKETLRTKCLVGLFEDMELSLKRFQLYFGWSQKSSQGQVAECRSAVLAAGDPRHNTPDLEPDSSMYKALAAVNKYDMELYEYAKLLYRIQGDQIFAMSGV